MFEFVTSYQQLRPQEKIFVDAFVAELEKRSAITHKPLSNLLNDATQNLDERSEYYLNIAMVRAAITERVKTIQEESELSDYKTLKELRALAYSNIANYMTVGDDGQPFFDLQSCTPEQMAAIKSIKIIESPMGGRKFEFALHDKVTALGKLIQYQGLDDSEHWKKSKQKTTAPKRITQSDDAQDAAQIYSDLIND